MKTLLTFLLFITVGILAVDAQTNARVVTEIAASSEKIVKNSPFSAEAVSESVQTLGDGNRIVRSSTSRLYRSADGRFRREGSSMSGGSLGTYFEMQPSIMILDPVNGFRYSLNSTARTARSTTLRPSGAWITIAGSLAGAASPMALANTDKARAELEALKGKLADRAVVLHEIETTVAAQGVTIGSGAFTIAAPAVSPAVVAQIDAERATAALAPSVVLATTEGFGVKGDFIKPEIQQLGTQNIEGVEAEGKRVITTIPAGKIGNERPIEIVYETWYSNELQLMVYSKNSDPRFGEQTYRLTN
ncbi:MAG: hypothetical protein ABI539_11920, partial [Acidobacteriota bacterium]